MEGGFKGDVERMEKEKQEGSEEEVITFKEFVENHKDIKEEEIHKIVLVCKNCGHKDLLKNFIRKKDGGVKIMRGDYHQFPPKTPPERFNQRWISRQTKPNGKKIMMAYLEHREYEDMFFCPKCKSSLVVLCKEFIKNNMTRVL